MAEIIEPDIFRVAALRSIIVVHSTSEAIVVKNASSKSALMSDSLAVRRMIAFVPIPSALSRTISARQTCFWAAFRSRNRASSRRRSASETTGGYATDRYYTPGGLLEVSGYLNNTGHTIGEWTAVGGTITLANPQVAAQQGSTFNISGGSVSHARGTIVLTNLLGSDGHIYSVDNAPADMTFVGLAGGRRNRPGAGSACFRPSGAKGRERGHHARTALIGLEFRGQERHRRHEERRCASL
jgi:hypothetical protein